MKEQNQPGPKITHATSGLMKPNIWHTRRTNVERPELLSSMISMIILKVENDVVDDHDKKVTMILLMEGEDIGRLLFH